MKIKCTCKMVFHVHESRLKSLLYNIFWRWKFFLHTRSRFLRPNSLFTSLKERVRSGLKRLKNRLQTSASLPTFNITICFFLILQRKENPLQEGLNFAFLGVANVKSSKFFTSALLCYLEFFF